MKREIFQIIAVMSVILLGAQAAHAQGAAAPPAAAAAALASEDDYRLGASDKVHITVYDEPTLTGDYSVSNDGNISFPLIGDVSVLNKTVGAAREMIRSKLADGYLRAPRVSAEVLTFRPFYVIGEVNHAGSFPYTAGLTVLKAVATASGFTYRANQKVVFIKRGGQAEEMRYPLTAETLVAPGDVIRIAERHF
jgi:protein involved in polysaccharide export with SLBB domain